MSARACTWIFAVCLFGGCEGSESEQTPILERSTRDPLRCEVISELRDFGLTVDDYRDQNNNVIQLNGEELWMVRSAEGEVRWLPRLVVSPLSFSVEPGEDQIVDEDGGRVEARELIALPGGGFAVLWIRHDPSVSLWFAAFDPAGAPTIAARQVEGIEPEGISFLRATVSSSGNIAVLYGGPNGSTRLAALDQAGDPWGSTHTVLDKVSSLTAVPDGGFAMLGHEVGPDGRAGQELLFLKIEETSESQADPIPVARPGDGRTSWQGAALVPLERGYLAAWTEVRHPRGNSWEHSSGSYSIIRLRRLDEHGEPLTAPVALRAKRDSVADRLPALARFGDQVAVFWSTGRYKYDCEMAEACSHRDRGQFILIDPEDLTPHSDLIEVLRDPAFPNGHLEPRLGDLLGTELSVRDSEVLVTATLEDDDDTRHAPGFASLRCE
jgi:hypothetical protein